MAGADNDAGSIFAVRGAGGVGDGDGDGCLTDGQPHFTDGEGTLLLLLARQELVWRIFRPCLHTVHRHSADFVLATVAVAVAVAVVAAIVAVAIGAGGTTTFRFFRARGFRRWLSNNIGSRVRRMFTLTHIALAKTA